MTVPEKTSRLTFADGLLESQETSKVPIGFLTDCINWVPEPSGGLRVRAAWQKGSLNGITTIRRCRGIGMFQRFTDPSIVQSTTVYQTTSTSGTPVLSWATPTQAGNTLVAFIAIASSLGATALTFTATGWTARNALPATTSTTVPACGVYELVTTQSFSGDTTPFTYSLPSGLHGVTMYIVELSGVTTFDKVAQANGVSTAAPPYSQTVTTAATTQASELVLAFDSAYRSNATSTTFELGTTSTGWSEYIESTKVVLGGFASSGGAIYSKAVRATGAQSITVDMTFTTEPGDNNYQNLVMVTYKGWNSVASPGATGSRWLAANDDGGTYDIVSVDRALNTEALNGPYITFDTNLGSTTDGDPVAFTMGLGAAWYTSATFSGIRRYDGSTPQYVTGSPVGARCLAVNKERLWAAGTSAQPSRLYFSQIGDGNTWSGTGTGYFDLGRDDGEVIEDITPSHGGLVIGKRTTLYFLQGDNTDQFQVTDLNGGGAAPGRSVLKTPYGTVIAGLEQVWLFDGETVTPIGRATEVSYGVEETDFVSLSYVYGNIYIATGSTLFAFDLNAGVWRKEQVGDGTIESPAIVYNYGDMQLMGPVAATVGSIINYRLFPDPIRGKDFDSLGEVFSAQTGDLSPAGVRNPITPRQLFLQLRQRGGDATEPGLIVTPIHDGVPGSACDVGSRNPGVRRTHVAGFAQELRINTIGVRFSQTLGPGQSSSMDIEDCWLDYKVEGTSV